ncbi:sulfatase [candidate division KSB1 bacterium]|nr:MAG: sulfatase [candidate division KSB1 bacterium]
MKKQGKTRRDFLKITGAGAAALILPDYFIISKKNKKQPNILFIMSDDHTCQAIGCYGSKINKTPNIDRIAEEGIRFNNCFCTNSICAPSRAVILTGKYNHINGVIDNSTVFDNSQETFPKILQKAGYQTAIIGKWHLKSEPTGFDYWNILPGQGDYYNPDFIEMGDRKNYIGYVTNLITDFSLNWLKNRDTEKPFCLMMHHKATHRNWMPETKYLNLFNDVNIPKPETFYDDYRTRSDAARQQEMSIIKNLNYAWDLKIPATGKKEKLNWGERALNNKLKRLTKEQLEAWNQAYGPKNEAFKKANLKGKDLDDWKYQRFIKDYLRCVVSIDDSIGRIFDYLDRTGLAENTIVIYTSDQGFYLGEHGWFDKRFMYEESLRMPLIIRYPEKINAGTVNNDMVLNLDFAPTFLDYAGADIPESMQGHSMKPILSGKTPENWRKSMYYHYYEYPAVHSVKRHYGIRTQRYKLIHFYYDIEAWELYDLKNDPHELNNLYGNPEYKDIVKRLKRELNELRKKYGDSDELTRKFLKKALNKKR